MESIKDEIVQPSYPCLKRGLDDEGKEFIVMFTDETSGTVVWTGGGCYWKIGYHSDYWEEERFTLFSGKITLKNL